MSSFHMPEGGNLWSKMKIAVSLKKASVKQSEIGTIFVLFVSQLQSLANLCLPQSLSSF